MAKIAYKPLKNMNEEEIGHLLVENEFPKDIKDVLQGTIIYTCKSKVMVVLCRRRHGW